MDVSIVEQSDSLTLPTLTGRLETAGVDRVESRVNAALLLRKGHGVLDLSQVTFLSSRRIRMSISAARLLARRRSRLVLVPWALVDQAIRHSSIDDIIPVAANVEEARALPAS